MSAPELPRRNGVRYEATPEQRAALLNDEEFLAPLDEHDRRLLRSLWELRGLLPPAPPGPGPVE